ncbi:uncharacterized protein [Montipora capricornis]|uniref:uncharacterized protein n=1 Tax=Montipora capricornis TaxID=246305 RepID=UPI0035F15D2C
MEPELSKEFMIKEDPVTFRRLDRRGKIAVLVLLAVAVIILTVGIVLIAVSSSKKRCQESFASTPSNTGCAFSDEAKKVGLPRFLSRVKETYYKLHPYDVYYDPDVDNPRVKQEYVAYDPTPSTIKKRTDAALALLKEINETVISSDKLKPRERKALAQVKHYLQHMFGQPYDANYYAGDWMLGPNLFCWQEICYHGYGVYNGIGLNHKPLNAKDLDLIEAKLKTHKEGILQYIENVKMGVRSGMVRSVEECKAGLDSIKRRYLNVSLFNETGKRHPDI